MITHPAPSTSINSNPAANNHVLMIRPSQKNDPITPKARHSSDPARGSQTGFRVF
jgi:hypothetical protein